MNHDLEFVPVPPADLDRIRCNGIDDYGNPFTVQTDAGQPLRCCLTFSADGEEVALVELLGTPQALTGSQPTELAPFGSGVSSNTSTDPAA
jgi:hypothetical protein